MISNKILIQWQQGIIQSFFLWIRLLLILFYTNHTGAVGVYRLKLGCSQGGFEIEALLPETEVRESHALTIRQANTKQTKSTLLSGGGVEGWGLSKNFAGIAPMKAVAFFVTKCCSVTEIWVVTYNPCNVKPALFPCRGEYHGGPSESCTVKLSQANLYDYY